MAAPAPAAAAAAKGVQYATSANMVKKNAAAAAAGAAPAAPPPAGAAPAAGALAAATAALPPASKAVAQVSERIKELTKKYAGVLPAREKVGQALQFFYYASVALFGLFLVLVFIHFTMYPIFSFEPGDGGIIPLPIVSDQQLYFKTTYLSPGSGSIPITELSSINYTLSFDMFLKSELIGTHAPRVLFYRGSTKKTVGEIQDTTVLNDYKQYGPYLLNTFDQTNIVLWLDPMKNDMHVGVVTGSGATKTMKISDPVENLPLGRPFRVTMVLTDKFVELYVDGRLKRTMTFPPSPVNNSSEHTVWALPAATGNALTNVKIASIAYWPRVLSSREIDANGKPITDPTVFQKL